VAIEDATPGVLQRFINEQAQSGLGFWSVDGLIRVLRTMFGDIVHECDFTHSPMARIKNPCPRQQYTDEDPNLFTVNELRAFLAAGRSRPDWLAMFFIQATTGLRFGEVSALLWTDVEGLSIRVRRSQYNGQVTPATKTGITKHVPLINPVHEALEDWREILAMSGNAKRIESGLVFPSKTGSHLDRGSCSRVFREILTEAKIEGKRVTNHGLRRTLNNLLRQVATGTVVRSITGHVRESMTDHYSQVALEEKAAAIQLIGAQL
jgi:integrase